MLLNLLEYQWVEDLDDALMLIARADIKTVPLAGGTYLLGLQDDSIQAVVDLRDLNLSYITEDARGIHIGATTTLQMLVEAPAIKNLAGGMLARAAQASSFSHLIRNTATLGGTLATGAASQADLLTALAVLDVEVLLRSGVKTQVNLVGGTADRPGLPLAGVTYKGKQERRVPYTMLANERRPNELILEVLIPQLAPGSGAAFTRIGRTPTDIALLNAASLVQVTEGVYKRVRLALGGVNMEPVRLPALEKQLEGVPADDPQRLLAAVQSGIAEFRPPSDYRASSGYRRVSGATLAHRVLEDAINISRWRDITSSEERA